MKQFATYDMDIKLSEATEDELLFYMSLNEEEEYYDLSRQAFGEFYDRYYIIIFNRIYERYNNFLTKEAAQDLTSQTFIKIFEKSGTFSYKGVQNPEIIKNTVLSWCFSIARNICLDEYSLYKIEIGYRNRKDGTVNEYKSMNNEEEINGNNIDISKIIEEVLNPKEQEVVLTTLEHFQIDKQNQRLSNEKSKQLAGKLGTTPENIRQIRRRAYKKIREYLQKH